MKGDLCWRGDGVDRVRLTLAVGSLCRIFDLLPVFSQAKNPEVTGSYLGGGVSRQPRWNCSATVQTS